MIIFDLTCSNNHTFEGWFSSPGSFEQQLQSGLVACPFCGSAEIRRVPSAIHLTSSSAENKEKTGSTVAVNPQGELLGAYRKLVSAILATSEDVGSQFAEEARRIHYLESPARSIRGQATEQEFDSLREEGIEVLRVPTVNKEDLN